MAEHEDDASGKNPWWFVGMKSWRMARVMAAWWLIFAAIGVIQFVITDDAVVRWIATVQCVFGLALSGIFLASARYSHRDRGRSGRSR